MNGKSKCKILKDIRKKIAENPKKFLKLIRDTEKATGLPITAEVYKRPKPTDNAALEPYFAWKSQIGCVVDEEFSEATFGPELGVRVCDLLKKLTPLYEFFNQFCV